MLTLLYSCSRANWYSDWGQWSAEVHPWLTFTNQIGIVLQCLDKWIRIQGIVSWVGPERKHSGIKSVWSGYFYKAHCQESNSTCWRYSFFYFNNTSIICSVIRKRALLIITLHYNSTSNAFTTTEKTNKHKNPGKFMGNIIMCKNTCFSKEDDLDPQVTMLKINT